MIILIAGGSHLAHEKYKYPYMSIDHIKMGLIRSGLCKLTPVSSHELADQGKENPWEC